MLPFNHVVTHKDDPHHDPDSRLPAGLLVRTAGNTPETPCWNQPTRRCVDTQNSLLKPGNFTFYCVMTVYYNKKRYSAGFPH